MTDERPLIEGIEAYHESLKEGARRERERILKLIDVEIKHFHDLAINERSSLERSFMSSAEQGLKHLKKRVLKEELKK